MSEQLYFYFGVLLRKLNSTYANVMDSFIQCQLFRELPLLLFFDIDVIFLNIVKAHFKKGPPLLSQKISCGNEL